MSKKFAVFDIDGTIFRWQLYHELFDALASHGVIAADAANKVFAARKEWQIRSDTYATYETELLKAVEPAIVGLPESTLHSIADEILREKGHQVYRYTSKLLKQLKHNGYTTIAISASHHELVERFCTLHSIDIAYGRKYQMKSGKVTEHSLLVHNRKDEILREIVATHNLTLEDSYAVGDSASDISMLEIVEHPIAFNPNTDLMEAATSRGWDIVIERKNIAYTLRPGEAQAYILDTYESF